MTFVIKEGGGVKGAIRTKICFKKPFRISLWLQNVFLQIVLALYYICIVVEVTMNMAEYGSQRPEQPANVNFEPIIRGPKSDTFDWDQM